MRLFPKFPAPVTIATALALTAAVAGPALAQNADPLTLLGLTDVQTLSTDSKDGDREVTGLLPEGIAVKVELKQDGRIEEVKARTAPFPTFSVTPLVPQAVRSNPGWPADALLHKLEISKDGRIEIEGKLANGRAFEAEFAADGTLIDMDNDD